MSRAAAGIAVVTLLLIANSAWGETPDRFAVRAVEIAAKSAESTDRRFAVQATAEIRRGDESMPRFSMKSALAGCAPFADGVFSNGFE